MTTMDRQCANGHAIGEGTAFCPTCGTSVDGSAAAAPRPSVCPNGHEVGPGNQFCPQCGAVVAGAAGVAPPSFANPAPSFPPPPPPGYGPQGYGAPGAQPNYAPQYVYLPQQPMCGLAIASFVLSIVWFYWITTIVGFVLGIVALRQIKQRNQRGRGFAIAGVVISSVWLVGLIALIVGIIVANAVSHSNPNESLALLHAHLLSLRP